MEVELKRLAVALVCAAGLVACGSTPPPLDHGSGSAVPVGSADSGSSGPATAPVPDAPAGPATVTDDASATANAGRTVEVHGTARTAKLAPAVLTDSGLVVYCLGLERWPAEVDREAVIAKGTLEQTSEFEAHGAAGEASAGTGGAVWVLRECTYTQ